MKYSNEELDHISGAMELMDEAVDVIHAYLEEMGHDKEAQVTMIFEILMNAAAYFATEYIADEKKIIVDVFGLLYELHSSDAGYTTKN